MKSKLNKSIFDQDSKIYIAAMLLFIIVIGILSPYTAIPAIGQWMWVQQWVPYAHIFSNLKCAVIASEDGDFLDHEGID